jgi:hypothetical protein
MPLGQIRKTNIEIPKNTEYKLEIKTDYFANPIMHDIKDNKVRKVNISTIQERRKLIQVIQAYLNTKGLS